MIKSILKPEQVGRTLPENPSNPSSWVPLFHDRDKDLALATLRVLCAGAESSSFFTPVAHEASISARRRIAASLDHGLSGIALYLGYRFRALGEQADRDNSIRLLNRAIMLNKNESTFPSLMEGFLGPAWVMAHLKQLLDIKTRSDDLDAIDRLLVNLLEQRRWSRSTWGGHFDLVNGLVGIGVYALERVPREDATRLVGLVIKALSGTSQRHAHGVCWPTPAPCPGSTSEGPNDMPGSFNMGMAHGQPGVLAFLALAAQKGMAGDEGCSLLRESTRWFVHQATRLRPLPSVIPPSELGPHAGATAWCYGELGASFGVCTASLTLSERPWFALATELAMSAARRVSSPSSLTGANSLGLCHGLAGLAHQFHRWYHLTGEEDFRGAAHNCFMALIYRGGVCRTATSRRQWGKGQGEIVRDMVLPGFFLGSAGVGLALLAAVDSTEPAWGRILLIHGE